MKIKSFIIAFCCAFIAFAQNDTKFISKDISITENVDGTLLTPKNVERPNLAILIAGSGPTDRNGNQNFLKNDSLKKLAESLSNNGIATFRYDKRVVKQLLNGTYNNKILFDDFVTDATDVITFFKKQNLFNRIYIIGHSQGSLVGMLAAKDKADGFISLAGAGQPIDVVITEQINKSWPAFTEDTKRVFAILKEGKTTTDYPQALTSVFNKDIQPFIMNWMQYNPQEVIKTLNMPILIINGTKDLQVSEAEAELLKSASQNATIKIIDAMNHVLVPIEGDTLENSKSYGEAYRKLSPELIKGIIAFIQS